MWDLLGTYAFLATFSNTVSTQEVSNCKSVRPSDCPSQIVSSLMKATSMDLFEIIQVALSRSEDVHEVWL